MLRRGFLKSSSAAILSSALPYPGDASQPDPSRTLTSGDPQVMDRLCTYMSSARSLALPSAVIECAQQHILDTFASMISGAALPPGRVALRFAQCCGRGEGTIVGSSLRCAPIESAFVNGMLAHADETDDSHSPSHSHPGCGVVPAALATGENFRVTGAEFLRAIALGYDVGTRITISLGGLAWQVETHRSTHSIANTFGASAAAASCALLDAKQMRVLLSYAAQQASGLASWQRDQEHIEKAFVFGGVPARNGVQAASMVQLGATGVTDVFAGPDNFLLAFGARGNAPVLMDGLGERFEITQTNLKKWTVGSPIQAPLDALQMIRAEHPFRLDQLVRVSVRLATSEMKTVNGREMQDISLQQMMAIMLVDGTVSFAASHDRSRIDDPAVREQRAKVDLEPDAELESLYPKLVAIVEVSLRDGRVFRKRVDAVRGTVANPMTTGEVIAKARGLMDPIIGQTQSQHIVEQVMRLHEAPDLRGLVAVLPATLGPNTVR